MSSRRSRRDRREDSAARDLAAEEREQRLLQYANLPPNLQRGQAEDHGYREPQMNTGYQHPVEGFGGYRESNVTYQEQAYAYPEEYQSPPGPNYDAAVPPDQIQHIVNANAALPMGLGSSLGEHIAASSYDRDVEELAQVSQGLSLQSSAPQHELSPWEELQTLLSYDPMVTKPTWACERCVKRRQICDGRHPSCGNCRSTNQSRCLYRKRHFACNHCRRRKQGCDLAAPACKRCRTDKRECVYDEPRERHSPEPRDFEGCAPPPSTQGTCTSYLEYGDSQQPQSGFSSSYPGEGHQQQPHSQQSHDYYLQLSYTQLPQAPASSYAQQPQSASYSSYLQPQPTQQAPLAYIPSGSMLGAAYDHLQEAQQERERHPDDHRCFSCQDEDYQCDRTKPKCKRCISTPGRSCHYYNASRQRISAGNETQSTGAGSGRLAPHIEYRMAGGPAIPQGRRPLNSWGIIIRHNGQPDYVRRLTEVPRNAQAGMPLGAEAWDGHGDDGRGTWVLGLVAAQRDLAPLGDIPPLANGMNLLSEWTYPLPGELPEAAMMGSAVARPSGSGGGGGGPTRHRRQPETQEPYPSSTRGARRSGTGGGSGSSSRRKGK
jgi:hypothetical protein